MRARQKRPVLRPAALALLLATVPSCGAETKFDWKNRELSWVYGPTADTATYEHLAATGNKGKGPIAKGWKCRLSDGRQLLVEPYELSSSHALFGKVIMIVGLFDSSGNQIETVRSAPITASNASFSFDLSEDVAKPLYDLVIWFQSA